MRRPSLAFPHVRLRLACTAGALCITIATLGAQARAPRLPLRNDAAQWCATLSDRLPGLTATDCRSTALVPTGAHSRNGFPLLIRRYSPLPETGEGGSASVRNGASETGRSHGGPIRILLLGGIHGDELTASAIVFKWMQSIQNSPGQNFQWDVVPILNPDGLMATRPNRVNARGVDLNRNFPTPNWTVEAPRYWIKETGSDPRRYPGAAPLSEPETRWVDDELQRFRPHVIISVHAPFGLLDFDGPAPAPQRFGRLTLNPVGVYPGSLGNYSGKFKNVPVITIELPNAQAMPSEAESKRIWNDMLDWINRNVVKRPN